MCTNKEWSFVSVLSVIGFVCVTASAGHVTKQIINILKLVYGKYQNPK